MTRKAIFCLAFGDLTHTLLTMFQIFQPITAEHFYVPTAIANGSYYNITGKLYLAN